VDEDARLKLLRNAGWTPNRRVSTTEAERALVENGFIVWSELAVFLAEYDGLTLRFVRPTSGGPDAVKLDARWAAAVADAAWMSRYAEIASARLAPVGAAYSEHLLI
jgi:hypothetical protein